MAPKGTAYQLAHELGDGVWRLDMGVVAEPRKGHVTGDQCVEIGLTHHRVELTSR
ncbi:MAG: hypothetical protein V9G15_03260 [Dermatophilaceae bacterium]